MMYSIIYLFHSIFIMVDYVTKQTIVNVIKDHIGTNNMVLDLLMGLLISSAIGYIFSNINKFNVIVNKIKSYFKKKHHEIIIENEESFGKQTSSMYGMNDELITAIYSYLKNEVVIKETSGNAILSNDVVKGKNKYLQAKNRQIFFKPLVRIILSKPFDDISIKPSERIQSDKENKTKYTALIIRSTISIENIQNFISHCYNLYIENEYGDFKEKEDKYFLTSYTNTSYNEINFNKITISPKKNV